MTKIKVKNPVVELQIKAENQKAIIHVTDNGSTIPECDRDSVTGRLVRLDNGQTNPGLALALVDAVVDLHGGC